MEQITILAANLAAIALPLALLEIHMEKESGWGGAWPKEKWYAKEFMPGSRVSRLWARLAGTKEPLVYHALMFGLILPAIFIGEFLLVTHNIPLLLASFVATLAVEDALWILLNWHFDARREMLKGPHGAIHWHRKWFKIGAKAYVPASYPTALALTLILLGLSYL